MTHHDPTERIPDARLRAAVADAAVPGVTRADLHCHSRASSGPAIAALRFIRCPESYSEPERVYDQAVARGMDLVTLTDHDTIDGAMELVERGFPRMIVGEEVTVHFPEDRCRLHLLVWGLTPERHEQIGVLRLRDDVYDFAHWLAEGNLPHALAHPLYVQNGRLRRWHVERCALLFKGFETLNGAHTSHARGPIERFIETLTPASVQGLVNKHGLEPLWPRVWLKARTGGSDDHALLNVGKAWTGVKTEDGTKIDDPRTFLRRVMSGACEPGGLAGHSSLLAHQLVAVGAHHFARTVLPGQPAHLRYAAVKALRFAGVEAPRPSLGRAAAALVRERLGRRRRTGSPLLGAIRREAAALLAKHPDLEQRLDPRTWVHGAPVSDHESAAAFADDLFDALHRSMAGGALRAARGGDRLGVIDHLLSYATLHAAQLPYLVSLFHQNKDRLAMERFAHEGGEPGQSAPDRPMRLSLFTDTLGDVNGVSRFIRNMAERARAGGRDLQILTSTRLPVPDHPNIFNFAPLYAGAMPRYENLEFVLPPLLRMLRHLDRHQPDAIHISTPGPVGLVGYVAAKMLRVPVLGVYHTDFPAYIDYLFQDPSFTWATERYMRFFYGPFRAVFTRSDDYVEAVARLGVQRPRIRSLMPGVDTDLFHPRFRDAGAWGRFPGVSADSVKVLYVGRVSVEKNMPLLVRLWKDARARLLAADIEAELIVVGDGPYRAAMERDLRGRDAHFLGFRHGAELSTLYASSDLFVFPSVTDTLGQVVMESQASGLPVLVSDVGGPKEVVAEGESGHVLPATDPAAWASTVARLAASPEERRRMGAAANRRMRENSLDRSFEHFWETHEEAWREHLTEHGAWSVGGAGSAAAGRARVGV